MPFSKPPTDLVQNIRKNPIYPFMMVLVLSASMGFQAWRTLLNNFSVEQAGIDGLQMGAIQSIREIPGFLVFLVVFVLLLIKEHRLASLSVILMGIGIALAGFFPTFWGIVITTLIMSIGFHYFETTNKSLTLQHFNRQESPLVMAQLRSYACLGNVLIGGVVAGLSLWVSYKVNFLVMGLFVIVAGIYTMIIDPKKEEPEPQHKKIILRKKYWLFYMLNLLSGARRQIFVVFAVFLLVEKYKFSIGEIAGLFVLNNVLSYFINPMIGNSINRFGERKVLSLEYVGLFFVFLGYTFLQQKWIIASLYILDHVFFNFSIGINTYLHKIADPKDIAPSTSVGFAINHIMAVFVPVVGGYLWLKNYQIPFMAGVILSAISLIFVQLIRIPNAESGQHYFSD